VQVVTAQSAADADGEYQAAITQLIQHTAPGFRPVPVSGLGTHAVRIPEWLVMQNKNVVCTASITRQANGAAPTPAALVAVARNIAHQLGW
jgi:hypothetical protein